MIGNTSLGTATLSGGAATLNTSIPTTGTKPVRAVYSGDAGNAGSTSDIVSVTASKAPTSVALVSSNNPVSVGQVVTFTATVSAVTGLAPDGETVTFKEGSTVLGTGVLSGGVATFTTSSLTPGTHPIAASFFQDATYLGNTSPLVNEVINP